MLAGRRRLQETSCSNQTGALSFLISGSKRKKERRHSDESVLHFGSPVRLTSVGEHGFGYACRLHCGNLKVGLVSLTSCQPYRVTSRQVKLVGGMGAGCCDVVRYT